MNRPRRTPRWESKAWLDFVRSLPCSCGDPRCPSCSRGAPDRVEAAHLRSHGAMGQKPHDFLVYPLGMTIHRIFHTKGHPSVEWQLERVAETIAKGLELGILRLDETVSLGLDSC